MDTVTLGIITLYITFPMLLVGFTTYKQSGLFGFIFGAMLGLIVLLYINLISIWVMLVFIVGLTAWIVFGRKS